VVNKVFGGLAQCQLGDKNQDGLTAWGNRFQMHTTCKKEVPGYVLLVTGPAQKDGQNLGEHRGEHCSHVADKIQEFFSQVRGRSIGVLCRKNDTVARMIYELRRRDIEASEEGGNPLTDSPAVEVILSLFALADHPGHSIAWFHLNNSPLKAHIESFADADALGAHLRRQLLVLGFGQLTHTWAKYLVPACNLRDLSRLQQLIEMAYSFQSRSTLRADEFVAWVRQQRVLDPSGASVRVMTIHGAKGLEFDVVVLPELDAGLVGQLPAFVVDRDQKSLDVTLVCRYADEATRNQMTETERRAFDKDRQQRVEESLSLLYVAMTRAVHALHLHVPGPRVGKSNRADAWYNLLGQTLAPERPRTEWTECTWLFEHGDARWFSRLPPEPATPAPPESKPPTQIVFRASDPERRRGMKHVAPSRREGQARVVLNRLFHPSEGTGMAAGTLYHAWFATIGWLDDGMPTDNALRAAAQQIRMALNEETWADLDRLLANFRGWLQNPAIQAVLRRTAYTDPDCPGFPAALAPFWTKTTAPQLVEQERPFIVRDGAEFWNGSFDRVVWLGDGDRTEAADVLDFKTDAIAPGDETALAARVEHYRPQLEAYRCAVARLAQLPPERIATRLVFPSTGCVKDIRD
jgi:ATP-dependent exoDNAse (exonuclease V) beta subunit